MSPTLASTGTCLVTGVISDIRLALRRIRRHPRAAVAIMLLFAVGTSGTTVVVSFLHAVASRPPMGTEPLPQAVRIRGVRGDTGRRLARPLSRAECQAMHQQAKLFATVACWSSRPSAFRVTPHASPIMVTLHHAEPGMFRILGVVPRWGRLPTAVV
jgi:hypothetical protein